MNKSFTDKLRERREFVESTNQMGSAMQRYGRGGGDPMGQDAIQQLLAQRANYNQAAEDSLKGLVGSQIQNGSNGVAVNPVAAKQDLLGMYTTNENKTNELANQYYSALNTLISAGLQQQKQAQDYSLGQGQIGATVRGQNLEYTGSPNGFDGSGTTSPLVDQTVQNIINGTASLDKLNVPQAVKNQIQAELTKRGYDPAAPFTKSLQQLQSAYGTGNKSIAAGGNFMKSGLTNIGEFLNQHTGGAIKIGDVNNIDNYNALRSALKGRGGVWDTIYSQLPTSQDTPDVANKKFQAVQDTINARFYPAGKPGAPTAKPKGNTDPLGILK